jgi:hypothetical protein
MAKSTQKENKTQPTTNFVKMVMSCINATLAMSISVTIVIFFMLAMATLILLISIRAALGGKCRHFVRAKCNDADR